MGDTDVLYPCCNSICISRSYLASVLMYSRRQAGPTSSALQMVVSGGRPWPWQARLLSKQPQLSDMPLLDVSSRHSSPSQDECSALRCDLPAPVAVLAAAFEMVLAAAFEVALVLVLRNDHFVGILMCTFMTTLVGELVGQISLSPALSLSNQYHRQAPLSLVSSVVSSLLKNNSERRFLSTLETTRAPLLRDCQILKTILTTPPPHLQKVCHAMGVRMA